MRLMRIVEMIYTTIDSLLEPPEEVSNLSLKYFLNLFSLTICLHSPKNT